jgi:hypothetical protein
MAAARPFTRAILLASALVGGALAVSAPASAIAGGVAEVQGFVAKVDFGPAGYDGSTSCSGSVINARFVLTAKSCLPGQSGVPTKSLTVTLPGYSLAGAEVLPHPDRDVALIRLAADLPAAVTPALLATAPPAEDSTVTVAGFGRTADEWVPDQLHAAPMTVTSVGASTLQTRAAAEVSTCKGDAGGPAFTVAGGRATVVAINGPSWQLGCLRSESTRGGATEVRVDDVRGWIDGLLRVRNNLDIFRNGSSTMCMSIDDAVKTAGARVAQWYCTDGPDQRWVQTALGGSTVQIKSNHSGLCAGVKASTAFNAPVSQETCSGAGQQWAVESLSSGEIRYRNKLNNSCLADPGSSPTAGVLMITWTCDGTVRADQQWRVQSRDLGRLLRNDVTNGCVRSTGAAGGYLVDQENCHGTPVQRFSFPSKAGTTAIVQEATGRCLTAADDQRTQLRLDPCTGIDRQMWTVTTGTVNGNAVLRFQSVFSKLCVGISGAGTAEGTHVIQWPCGAADHWFRA